MLIKFGFNQLVGSKVIRRDHTINQPGLWGKEARGEGFNPGLDERKAIKVHLHLNIKEPSFEVLLMRVNLVKDSSKTLPSLYTQAGREVGTHQRGAPETTELCAPA